MAEENAPSASCATRLLAGLTDLEVFRERRSRARVPHNLNISFAYVEGESLIMAVEGHRGVFRLACTSASLEPSYVLLRAGRNDELAHSSIRFTIGRFTTEEEIDRTIDESSCTTRSQAARALAAVGDARTASTSTRCSGQPTEL